MIQQIYIRLSKEQKFEETTNFMFIRPLDITVKLCSIPEFVGEVKCDCGNKASVIMNDTMYKCEECIKLLLSNSKLKKKKDTPLPLTKASIRDVRFEWSVNREKWYIVYGKKIKTDDWNAFLQKIKNMFLHNTEELIDGDYAEKTMTVL